MPHDRPQLSVCTGARLARARELEYSEILVEAILAFISIPVE